MKWLLFVALQQAIGPGKPIIQILLVDTPKSINVNTNSSQRSLVHIYEIHKIIVISRF